MAYQNLDTEELARKFGGQIEGGSNAEALARKFGARIAGGPLTAMEAGGALSAGVNRGVVAGLGGLPAKVGADIIDLGRAAYGYAGNKLGMLTPGEMPQPLDRSQVVMSPEWIADKLQGNRYTAAAINNPRPDSGTARTLNAGGHAVGTSMAGRPADMAMQFASGTAGQLAAEGGASPEWAMVASMSPQVAAMAASASARGVMRGGEEGRQEMQARMVDFERAGVDPSVGLATGKRRTQAIESALSKTPGGAGVMARKVEDMQQQLGDTANAARDRVSSTYGPVTAGDAIKQGVSQYRGRQQEIYGRMNDRAMGMIPEGMRFPADAMLARGQNTLAAIPGAPNVSRVINAPLGFTQDTLSALRSDVSGKPPQQSPSRILQQDGQPFMSEMIPATPGGVSIEALRGLKSRVGDLAYAQNPLMADANTGAMKSLYGGAKQDLITAGALADAERVNRGMQPGALREMQRADRFYAQTQTILEKTLAPLYKAGDPASEKGYYRLEQDFRNSGKQAQRAMASLPLDVRREVTATAVDRMGRATPGQQNAEGSAFSPQTFLTSWNKLTPEGKAALFGTIPNGSTVAGKLDGIARSASMMRDANRVYANPSGTAQATNLTGAGIGALSGGVGLVTGNATAGLATLGAVTGSMAAAYGGARLMTSPMFVTWLSQTTAVKPAQMRQHLNRLSLNATQEKDPEQRAALENFVADFAAELNQ